MQDRIDVWVVRGLAGINKMLRDRLDGEPPISQTALKQWEIYLTETSSFLEEVKARLKNAS